VDKAKRWSNATKKEIQVTQPAAVKQYNANMGGTDRMDQKVCGYRISIHRHTGHFLEGGWLDFSRKIWGSQSECLTPKCSDSGTLL